LREWHICPKRWWLLKARYSNASTPYPQVPGVATLKGRIIHHAVEKFTEHALVAARNGSIDYPKLRAAFPVRRIIKDYVASELETELTANPRVDASRLLTHVSIDDCVNGFKEAAAASLRGLVGGRPSVSEGTLNTGRPVGSEMWLETDSPRLCGRLDLVLGGAIYDFKTGGPDPKHADQLEFYGLLIWLKTGTLPSSLTLVYTKSGEVEEVDVPTPESLDGLRSRYAEEIASIETVHQEGNPSARPDVETCRYCPVRHLCDEYWDSIATQSLRLGAEVAGNAPTDDTLWLDVHLEDISATESSNGLVGYAHVTGVGRVRVSIAITHCTTSRGTQARILGGGVRHEESGFSVRVGGGTEAFWL
jgi:CRISPR/Cas system-associated exonuclease Cas4 (RecB family)